MAEEPKTEEVKVEEHSEETPEGKITQEPVDMNKFIESTYLTLKQGESCEFTFQAMRKVTQEDNKYNLSGKDFKYEIDTEEGKILSINAWKAVGAFRELAKTGDLTGKKIKAAHPSRGVYTFELVGE